MNEELIRENNTNNISNRDTILLMKTNVELLEIYDKTFANIKNASAISKCNIDSSLLLNALFLSLQQLLRQMHLQYGGKNNFYGGKNKFHKTRKYQKKLISKSILNRKQSNKRRMQKTKRNIGLVGGSMTKLITSLMLTILTILNITEYTVGVQPEYDNDVLDRLKQVEKIKDIFENKYGTCSINTALFLGSIDLNTYEKVTENIIERGHGLSYSEISQYLNSSIKTLWEWDLFSIPKDKNVTTRYLRGAVEMEAASSYNQQIRDYINIIKNKMREIKEQKIEYKEQGILTAMMYPSYSVHHAVVVWLSSDDTLVIIDPQEFVESGIVLYSDNLSKYTQFESKSIEEYFSQYLDDLNDKKTAILMNYHVKRQENLLELTENNEQVKKVIGKMQKLESNEN